MTQWHRSQGWPTGRNEIPQDMRPYWTFRDNLEVIDGVLMKGRCIITPEELQRQALEQLHSNHMGIENKQDH